MRSGRGGEAGEGKRVIKDRQIGSRDPIGQRAAHRVGRKKGVPKRVVNIEVTEDEGGAGRGKKRGLERGGATVKRRGANRRRINIKKGISRVVKVDIKKQEVRKRIDRGEARRRLFGVRDAPLDQGQDSAPTVVGCTIPATTPRNSPVRTNTAIVGN